MGYVIHVDKLRMLRNFGAMSTYVETVIRKFGGLSPLARALGHRNVTTVQGWRVRGSIPAAQQARVLSVARGLGIQLSPSDFFDLPSSDAISRGEAA